MLHGADMASMDSQTAKQASQQDDAVYKLMPSPAVRGGPFRMPRPVSVDLSQPNKATSPLPMGPPSTTGCDLQQVPQLAPRPRPDPIKEMGPPTMLPPMAPPQLFTLQSSVLSKYNVREEGDPIKRLIREGVEIKDDRKQLKLLLRKRKSGNFESMCRDSLSSADDDSADDEETKYATLYDDARLIHPANEPNVKVVMDEPNARFHKDMTSEQVEEQCAREDIGSVVPTMVLLENYSGPHFPARDGPRLTREQLLPATPCVSVQTTDQALGPKLKRFCTSYPITVVRNICQVLEIDLGLFSTKVLAQSNPEHPIEVRTQFQQSCEENWDADKVRQVWRCESHRSHTTVSRYAQYQAGTFVESLKGELKEHEDLKITAASPNSNGATPEHLSDSDSNSGFGPSGAPKQKRQRRTSSFKSIKFGTNLDLSDRKKWSAQLKELEKLPPFTRVVDEANMLSHVGHTILGMNTVQLYMKVPGSRTPGHQENNNFCSVNINIGPGDCEWFGVDDAYWGDIHALCEKNGTSYLFGSWWPLQEDLLAANIPVYRFTQKPGDMVFVNAGCVHWVQASGWCNNIAWNIGPFNYDQFRLGVERYEWNKMQGFKSIVPMLHLAWNLARNVQFVNAKQADKVELAKLTADNESLMDKVLQLQDLGEKATESDRQRRIRNVQPVDERLFDLMRTCLMSSLRSVERQRRFVKKLGKDIIFHGRNDDEVTYYCNTCDVEVFNVLFVKEIDKKHMVHCIECALKLSKTLKNIVVLEEFTREDLHQIYDNFTLKKISDLRES